MAGRLANKVALITGAGCVGPGWGNGRAIAVRFAEEGAKVFAVDREPGAHGRDRRARQGSRRRDRDASPATSPTAQSVAAMVAGLHASASAASTCW